MAKNITLLGASYADVPTVLLPQTGGGTARFDDASVTTAVAADVASGKIFIASDGTKTLGTAYILTYVSSGLVAYWDAINNTGNGHSSTVTTWTDLVGGYDMTEVGSGATWTNDALRFNGITGNLYRCPTIWELSANATIEIVLRPSSNDTCVVATFDSGAESGGNYDGRRLCIYSDNTIGFVGARGSTYTNPATDLTGIRKTVVVYNNFTVVKALANNTVLSLGSTSHSFRIYDPQTVYIGGNDLWTYPYSGDVCAIRVYNRALSDAEIAQNMTYDNARFNLGL